MFKKKENGFSLVELAVAAAIATALAVVAVSVVTGTATSVSEKGSSAAAAESCTISESLKGGTDETINDCGTAGNADSGQSATPIYTFTYSGSTPPYATFGLNGSSGDFYDEAMSSWTDSNQVLSISLSAPGVMTQGGWYMWESGVGNSVGSLYGSWNYTTAQYSDNILVTYNQNSEIQSIHLFFNNSADASTFSPNYFTDWSSFEG